MVGTTLTIERGIEDARSTRDAGVGSKRKDWAEDFYFTRVSRLGQGLGM